MIDYVESGTTFVDRFFVNVSTFEERLSGLPSSPSQSELIRALRGSRDAVDGAFKTSGLRNVELTGPFFHNGGQATLEQVVEFYNRGGDRRRRSSGRDTTGFGPNSSNLDPDIESLGLSSREQRDLVAFLKALTDERVRWECAPFDHPALVVPHGHRDRSHSELSSIFADDRNLVAPAVGRNGRRPLGLPPLEPFHEQLR